MKVLTFVILSMISILGLRLATSEALALTEPVTFVDCVYNGKDCCDSRCRPFISACCDKNICRMKQLTPTESVKGTGPFKGYEVRCSDAMSGFKFLENYLELSVEED